MAETIGSLVDKISIMELKIYHMQEQVERADAAESHRAACLAKLGTLTTQRNDLASELSSLYGAVSTGKKELKIYRQYKMYNDPVFRIPGGQ